MSCTLCNKTGITSAGAEDISELYMLCRMLLRQRGAAAAVCGLLLCLVDLSAAVNKKLPTGTKPLLGMLLLLQQE